MPSPMASRACSTSLGRLPTRLASPLRQTLPQLPRHASTSTTTTTTPATSVLLLRPSPSPSQPLLTQTRPPQRALLHTTPTLHNQGLLQRLTNVMPNLNTYRVYSATERIYKQCAAQADYVIDAAARKAGTLNTAEDGEEIGEGKVKGGVWHTGLLLLSFYCCWWLWLTGACAELALPPTFSTWAQVTMLHMYLLVVRFRCFDEARQQAYQAPLVNHFFHEAEAKMEDLHALTSGALRQRYLKDLFVQWRGLILAYDEGIVKGDAVLAGAVWRNLFKADEAVDVRAVAAVVAWMRAGLERLGSTPDVLVEERAAEAFPDLRDMFKLVDVPTAGVIAAREQEARRKEKSA